MYRMALDPGGTTGWKTLALNSNGGWEWRGGFFGPDPHHLELWYGLETISPNIVICESFQHTQGKSIELISCEYIGIVKAWCAVKERQLVMQTSAQGKGFWTDDKLKRVDLYVVNKHIRDATRHLLHYMSFTKHNRQWIDMLRK